jgi:hypothetical protein
MNKQAARQIPLNVAVKSYLRLVAPIHESYDMALECDSTMCPDGYGSHSLHDRMEVELALVAMRVAERFHIPMRTLQVAADEYMNSGGNYHYVSRRLRGIGA